MLLFSTQVECASAYFPVMQLFYEKFECTFTNLQTFCFQS